MSSQQLPLNLGYRPALGRTDLLVTDGIREAVTWIDKWPAWPSHALALFGPAGCGKTHLVHVFAAVSQACVVRASELPSLDPVDLASAHEAVAMDCSDEPIAEEALLHLYNAVHEENGHLLIAARDAPARWPIELPDLQSRLKAMPAVQIRPPDDATIMAVVTKLFRDRQLSISSDVIDYVIARIPRTFSASRRLVDRADKEALAQNRRVTVPLIRDIISDPDLFSSD